jgi:hypothetical protein
LDVEEGGPGFDGTWLWPGLDVEEGGPGFDGTWLWPGLDVEEGGPGFDGTWLLPGLDVEDGGVAPAQNLLTDSPAALAADSSFVKATEFVPFELLGLLERAA